VVVSLQSINTSGDSSLDACTQAHLLRVMLSHAKFEVIIKKHINMYDMSLCQADACVP